MRIGDVIVIATARNNMAVVHTMFDGIVDQRLLLEGDDEQNLRKILNHRHDFRFGIKDVAEFSSDKDRISYYIFISMPIKYLSPLLARRPLRWFQERWG